ncbi:cytochrome P450 monooxygenase-like protein [Astrocystis sublimbata]|nr:cytochrome P450 monooxygenase-like protein [Astrocystis sublimbata]
MILLYALSITAGLVAHHGFFIHGEWHMKTPRVILIHALLGVTAHLLISTTGHLRQHAIHHLLIVYLGYFASLFTSITIYRVFFHATVSFPGPRLAAVTKFWHIFHILDSRNFLFLQCIYEKYGPIVRTGPNEIFIFHPAGIQLLDGWNNDTTKDDWYDVLQPRSSAIFTRDEFDHNERRKPWIQSLATKPINAMRHRISEQALSLSRCIAKYGGEPIELNEIMSWFSFDAMAEAVFGQDFDLMNSRTMHPVILHRDRALALLGPIGVAMWIARLVFACIPFYGRIQDWFRMVSFCDEHMSKRMTRKQENPNKPDMASWFIKEYHALESDHGLKAQQNILSGTVVSAVVAGSDTSRASLVATWWYLCKYPEHADKIRAEIEGVNVTDANELARLPHLNGVINEILRLVPPAMTGNGRITGPSGLRIGDVLIPPFTKVTAPKYVIHRLEAAFEYPNEFIPERWYSRPELIRDKRAFAPFSAGTRQCVGKALAYIELRLVTAILLQHYNVRFADGYDPETMWRLMKDQVTAQPGPVRCVFEPRG